MSFRRQNLDHFRSFSFNISAAGTAEKLTIKYASKTTIAFNNQAQNVTDTSGFTSRKDTITDSANGFFGAGFKTGDQVTISGAVNAANNGTFVIYDMSVTGGTIILTSSGALTTETAGNSVTMLSPVTIPEGVAMTIKAKKANTQKIYVGQGKLNAQGHSCFTLSSNESLFLQLKSSDTVWLDADVSAEGVEVNFEQNKQGIE